MSTQRLVSVIWQGSIEEGTGFITSQSKALEHIPLTLSAQFDNEVGTNPEELIAAAQASSFNLLLARSLTKEKYTITQLKTTVKLDVNQETRKIDGCNVMVTAIIPSIEKAVFASMVSNAAKACTIIALVNVNVTLDYRLLEK